jgi:hypothetical protein
MLMSALLSLWSSAVFTDGPTAGFSAVLFVFGVGLTIGPASLGALAGPFGLRAGFAVSAAGAALALAARPGPGGKRGEGGSAP